MIDYIKAYFANKDLVFTHLNNSYGLSSNKYERFDRKRNEMVSYNTYFESFENLFVKITNERAFVGNSLHALYNRLKGAEINRNDNDYFYSDLVETIQYMETLLGCPPTELALSQGLAFGFNLE